MNVPNYKAKPGISMQRLEALRYVADWAWSNHIVPSEIHDAAAFALDFPSLAHGFYTPSDDPNGQLLTDERATED